LDGTVNHFIITRQNVQILRVPRQMKRLIDLIYAYSEMLSDELNLDKNG